MNNETKIDFLLSDYDKIKNSYSALERLYPRIKERKATLSVLGISPRTFNHWKENGLVWYVEPEDERRSWVRLNVYEFIWLRVVIVMREFGLPLEAIRSFKEKIERPLIDVVYEESPEVINQIIDEKNLPKEVIDFYEKGLNPTTYQIENLSLEDKQAFSLFGSYINRIILLSDPINLVVKKDDEKGFSIDFFEKKFSEPDLDSTLWRTRPYLNIPLTPFVEELINEPKNETNIQEWGLINANERKVLEAIRKENFRKIVIKRYSQQNDYIIELTTDKKIVGDDAKKVKTILGLAQYVEVTIKYRNDKELYFRNTKKL